MPNRKQTCSYVDDWKSLWKPDLDAIAYGGATTDPTRLDEKVVDWVKENCSDKPHFVKIINRNACHDQPGLLARSSPCLNVPGPFVEEHYHDLQRVVTLEKNGEPGKKWKVAFLPTTAKYPKWSQGWLIFARDNNLKPGDVVVFELLRNSHFRFTHFDEDGNINSENSNNSTCNHAPAVTTGLTSTSQSHGHPSSATHSGRHSNPRVTRNRVTLSDNSNAVEVEAEAAHSPQARSNSSPHRHIPAISNSHILKTEPDVPATPQLKRRRLVKLSDNIRKATPKQPRDCEGCGEDSVQVQNLQGTESPSEWFDPLAFTYTSKRRPVTAAERQRAEALAEAHSDVTTSPNFLVVMSETHLYGRFQLILPDQFVKESGLPQTGCRMTFEDCRGKTRDLYSRENVNFQVGLIRKGWAMFALEHLLEEGDACVFELADKDDRSILVRIFRVVQIPEDVDRTSFHDHYEIHKKVSRS